MATVDIKISDEQVIRITNVVCEVARDGTLYWFSEMACGKCDNGQWRKISEKQPTLSRLFPKPKRKVNAK